MNKYAVINLKTDPGLKKKAAEVADKLGVSISAVLNNELQRFATEGRVVFGLSEIPNPATKKELELSQKDILSGEYHRFANNKAALQFLTDELS